MTSLIQHFMQFVTENKKEKIQNVLNYRTSHLTLVLEDIFQPQNASATLRTCECLGIQHIHVIENRNSYNVNPLVVQGASKWISLHRHTQQEEETANENTARCLQTLRKQGYRIVATSPEIEGYTPETLPITCKTAILDRKSVV